MNGFIYGKHIIYTINLLRRKTSFLDVTLLHNMIPFHIASCAIYGFL